jgi:hypothetical protein
VGKKFLKAGFKDAVTEILCGLYREKPGTTWDNWVADWGTACVEGYIMEGMRVLDDVLEEENCVGTSVYSNMVNTCGVIMVGEFNAVRSKQFIVE